MNYHRPFVLTLFRLMKKEQQLWVKSEISVTKIRHAMKKGGFVTENNKRTKRDKNTLNCYMSCREPHCCVNVTLV